MDGRAKSYVLAGAATRTTTGVGSAVDLQDALEVGNKRSMLAHLSVGAQSGTTLDVKITECDTSGGTYTDITGAAFTQVGAALSEQDLFFQAKKRYVKASWTIAGTNYSFSIVVTALKKQA